jgi:hypothetical protein
MSRQEFAEFFSIPYRTLQNWELGTRECPEYLLKLIEYKLTKEGFFREKTYALIPKEALNAENADAEYKKLKQEIKKAEAEYEKVKADYLKQKKH